MTQPGGRGGPTSGTYAVVVVLVVGVLLGAAVVVGSLALSDGGPAERRAPLAPATTSPTPLG